MLEVASQIVLCLAIAALLGFIIGYLIGKMSCKSDDCHAHDTHSNHGHSAHINTKNH